MPTQIQKNGVSDLAQRSMTIKICQILWEPRRVSQIIIDRETEQAVRRFIDSLVSRSDMAGAILFGSRARGAHQPDSDADVAVLLRGEHRRFLATKLAMADVAFDVLLETGINISPLSVWLDEWEHPETYSNPALLQNIAREGVRL